MACTPTAGPSSSSAASPGVLLRSRRAPATIISPFERSPADETERGAPALAALLDDGPAVGVHAICLDDDERMLPQECAVVVRFHNSSSTRVSVCRAGGPGVDDAIADTASLDWAERLARALAPLRVDTSDDGGAAALPGHVRWTEIAALPPTRRRR